MSRILLLLIVPSLVAGGSAVAGSIVGSTGGRVGLFVGATLGGLSGAAASAVLARWLGWIRRGRTGSTAVGATIGFALAALIATQTLSSPVGPVLSTFLVGVGALVGSIWQRPPEEWDGDE